MNIYTNALGHPSAEFTHSYRPLLYKKIALNHHYIGHPNFRWVTRVRQLLGIPWIIVLESEISSNSFGCLTWKKVIQYEGFDLNSILIAIKYVWNVMVWLILMQSKFSAISNIVFQKSHDSTKFQRTDHTAQSPPLLLATVPTKVIVY